MKAVVLIGPPGSGKTSLAEAFVQRDAPSRSHISSGKIAANLALNDTHTQMALQKGEYAPESAIRMEVAAQIEQAEVMGQNIVLDGFPRRIEQLFLTEKWLKSPLYVQIHCDGLACLRRILARNRVWDQADAVASRFETYNRDTLTMIRLLGEDIQTIANDDSISQGVYQLEGLAGW